MPDDVVEGTVRANLTKRPLIAFKEIEDVAPRGLHALIAIG